MSRQHLLPALLAMAALATVFGPPSNLGAQQGAMSARQAIDAIGAQFGPGAVQWLAEIRGRSGIPQPNSWEVLAYNDRSPGLLHKFWAGGGRVGDAGADDTRYPVNIPVGYFGANQIPVDSVAAFTIAEGEARKARMAFDSCDYFLRVREYSTEPIWRLELLDPRRQLVGKIYLSARNGEVLRTVWIYYNNTGRPQIVDSFAPTRPASMTSTTSTTQFPPTTQNPIRDSGLSDSTGIMAPPVSPTSPGAPLPPAAPPASSTGIAGNSIPSPTFPPNNGRSAGTIPSYNPGSNNMPAPIPPTNQNLYDVTGIPEPPAIESTTEEPKPPVVVPESEGSSDRIPPPPIPNS